MLGQMLATTVPQMQEHWAGQRVRWPVSAQRARLRAGQSCHLAILCLCSPSLPPASQTDLLASEYLLLPRKT